MRFLTVLFIVIPALEIMVLLLSGKTIGVLPTLLIILLTGILGAWFAKKQGIEVLKKIQQQIQFGQIPSDAIIDGICILIGGLLLLTPGYITDISGLILLIPFSRNKVKPLFNLYIRKMIERNNVTIIR